MNLKSKFLASVRPFHAPDDDKKSAAQTERDKIKVTSIKPEDEVDDKKDDKTDDKGDDDKDDKGEEGDDDKGEEGEKDEEDEGKEGETDDDKDDNEKKELTAEQKEIASLKKQVDRLQKRVGRTAGERDTIKKELKDAKASLEAKLEEGTQPLTEEEVVRRAKELADTTITQREFDNIQDRLIKDAKSIDKDFMNKVNDLAQEVSPLPGFMIGLLGELDNGGAVLNHLTDNVDEYEEIYKFSPAKMAIRLAKISDKLIEAAKPKKKKISEVPDPPGKLKGGASSPDVLPANPTKNMAEFARIRAKQVEERRKQKLGLA